MAPPARTRAGSARGDRGHEPPPRWPTPARAARASGARCRRSGRTSGTGAICAVTDDEIRVGTRGSTLALVQALLVVGALEQAGHRTRLVVIETEGDRRAPNTAWGEGAFVTAIAAAVIDGRVDLAVHSAKD